MHKAWLFDLDGTLADTALDLTLALNHVLKLNNKPPLKTKIVRPYAAYGSSQLIELGFGSNAKQADKLKTLLLDYYKANVAVKTKLFKNMQKVLNMLKKNHIPWGVVTNKPERFTMPLLKKLNVLDSATIVVSGDTCAHSKPHPEPVLHACTQLGIAPDDTLFIGDSSIDLEATTKAGVDMIVALYGYLQATDKPETWNAYATVKQPIELLNFI